MSPPSGTQQLKERKDVTVRQLGDRLSEVPGLHKPLLAKVKPVQEAAEAKMETRVGPAPGGEGLPDWRTAIFLLCALSQGQKESKVPGALPRTLIPPRAPFPRAYHPLISQRPHLQVPVYWGLAFNL